MIVAFVAAAAPLTPENVVIIDSFFLGHSLLEYRSDGTLVQTVQIPYRDSFAGGMTFDEQGLLWIYNGNIEAYLSSWNSQLDIWIHRTCAGWGSFLCIPCQGIGTIGNFVFVTDEGAYGNPNGLVRFDRGDTNICVRFADGRNYSALAVGLDGVLYARRADDVEPPPPTVIDAFDPTTLGLFKSVTLSDRSLSIAADAQGQLYGASGQSILRYSADGLLLDLHKVVTNGALYTLALSQDRRFVVVSSDGEVVITDSNFTPQDRFSILTGSQAYAAIVPPPRPTLSIQTTATNSIVISWPSLSIGWTLQQNSRLNPTNWTDVLITPPDNGTNKSVVVSPLMDSQFYRLILP